MIHVNLDVVWGPKVGEGGFLFLVPRGEIDVFSKETLDCQKILFEQENKIL